MLVAICCYPKAGEEAAGRIVKWLVTDRHTQHICIAEDGHDTSDSGQWSVRAGEYLRPVEGVLSSSHAQTSAHCSFDNCTGKVFASWRISLSRARAFADVCDSRLPRRTSWSSSSESGPGGAGEAERDGAWLRDGDRDDVRSGERPRRGEPPLVSSRMSAAGGLEGGGVGERPRRGLPPVASPGTSAAGGLEGVGGGESQLGIPKERASMGQ